MDTSCEKVKRALDVAWRNYTQLDAASQGLAQRSTIILGASVAGIGIMFKDIKLEAIAGQEGYFALATMIVSIAAAFVCAGIVAAPRDSFLPSGLDDNRIWHRLVSQEEPAAAANLLRDICAAAELERKANLSLSRWLTGCVASCGLAVIASMAVKVLAGG